MNGGEKHIKLSVVSETALLGLALVMPLYKKAVPALVLLLGISLLVDAIRFRQFHWKMKSVPMVSLLLMYALLCIGYVKTTHADAASTELVIKLSFFVFPLFLCFVPRLSKEVVHKAFDNFIYGALLFAPLAIGIGLWKSLATGDWGYLTYQELGLYFHPTYIATYEAWAFFMLALKWWKGEWLFGRLTLHALAMLVVLIFVGLLASKAGFIAIAIAIGFAAWYGVKCSAGMLRSAAFAIGSIAIFVSTILLTPASLARLDAALPATHQAQEGNLSNVFDPANLPGAHSSSGLRLVTWETSWQLLKANPLGVGTGNSTPRLVEAYKAKGEDYAAFRELNSHNQFLQSGVELGWLGVLVWMLFLGVGSWQSMQRGQPVMLLFYTLLGMNFLFESFMEVQAGIIFTAFVVWLEAAAPSGALKSQAE